MAPVPARATPSPFTEHVDRIDWDRPVNERERQGSNLEKTTKLRNLKYAITDAETTKTDAGAMAKVREVLHDVAYLDAGLIEVRDSRLMGEETGLPRLWLSRNDGFQFDFDVRADAKELWLKWRRQDFDTFILRGISINKKGAGGSRSMSISKEWGHRLKTDFGNGDLVNGQWWPRRICALRDGAHGETQAGIAGIKNQGATSIVVAGHYDDVDEGDTLLYCGTEGTVDKGMSDDTKLLIKNVENRKPVRVIRKARKPKADERPSDYMPTFGLRYDGVYDVISYEILNVTLQHCRFRMVRQAGQDPIRSKHPHAKPTSQDVEKYQAAQRLWGWGED